ncbi:MAG: hypothetical protein M0R17_04395 [Candidatus Omnitrophica bacterium]|jgi:hypothetical protein|nr:hypothetical protein [Candidatus Omnitrophota bacterium]
MEDKKKIKKPNSVEPKLIFFSLRAIFSLINKANKDVNPKDYPNKSTIEIV